MRSLQRQKDVPSDVSKTLSHLTLASMTLFDKYGGMPTMIVIIRNICTQILSRPNLARYYEGMDLEQLVNHSITFVAHLLGKPVFLDEQLNDKQQLSNVHLRRHHHHLGITQHSYGQVVEILREELIAAKFEPADVEIAMNILYDYRKDIVTRR